MTNRTYVTLLTTLSYLAGTLVLNHSLQTVGSKYPLLVLVTSALPAEGKRILQEAGIQIKEVDTVEVVQSRYNAEATVARLRDVWTKIRAFELEEYDKIVFLDSDMVVRRNMDELFDVPITRNQTAGVHACTCNPPVPGYRKDWLPENCGYRQPDYLQCLKSYTAVTKPLPSHLLTNTGMFVAHPSADLYRRIKKLLDTSPLIPGWKLVDQDLIGVFFGGGGVEDTADWGALSKEELGDRWIPLPYYYNSLKTLRKTHTDLWKDEEVRCVHYIRDDKPWKERPPKSRDVEYNETHRWWWEEYDRLVNTMTKKGQVQDVKLIESLVDAGNS
ncbi:nucleotide-diphospho-sugar transferase [Serendipita vermifera]|nr:nucleotide-diphospho-sugar transferase [Serendipita vermifera]